MFILLSQPVTLPGPQQGALLGGQQETTSVHQAAVLGEHTLC